MKLMDDRIKVFHLNSLPFRKFLNVFILPRSNDQCQRFFENWLAQIFGK